MIILEPFPYNRSEKRPPDPELHRRERVRRACEVIADQGGVFVESRIRKCLRVARDFGKGVLAVEELIAALIEVRLVAREANLRANATIWTLAEAQRAVEARAIEQVALAVVRALSQALDPAGCMGHPAPARLDRKWLTSTVVTLAQLIEVNGQFDLLPILADALEDAGCGDPAILDHCRAPSPHGPECWVVAGVLRGTRTGRMDSPPGHRECGASNAEQ